MTKFKTITAAIMVAGVSTLAHATTPQAPPQKYNDGPLSPSANSTELSVHERAAFAMMEAILQMTEGKVHADSCVEATVPVEVYSDSYDTHNTVLGSFGNNVELVADVTKAVFRGQKVLVKQDPGVGHIAGTGVGNYKSVMVYNAANNMMTGDMALDVMGANGNFNQFTGQVIKDFFMGVEERGEGADPSVVYLVLDWGLQTLSKLGYPAEKWWQRSKVRRDDGGIGRTVFVKDRLVGNSPCRITIDTYGDNGPDLFWQSGELTIEWIAPSEPVPGFDLEF